MTRGPNQVEAGTAYYVYMLASRRRGTLYIGVTGDLVRRVFEHRRRAVSGFTQRHGVDRLVWFEAFDGIRAAIQREKTMKHRLRAWKIALVEPANPTWLDLYDEIAT